MLLRANIFTRFYVTDRFSLDAPKDLHAHPANAAVTAHICMLAASRKIRRNLLAVKTGNEALDGVAH